MADWKVPELGNKTLLQYANTPEMDRLARLGRTGMLKTVPDGFHPGSEVANSSILGYDQHKVYEGRGPLEAASIGVELAPDDLAMRCNLICIEDGKIKNHSCGRLETSEGDVLIKFLQEKLGNDRIHFYTGVQYRHLLVIKGGNKHLDCTPPHDVPGKEFRPLMIKAQIPEAEETAALLNRLILESQIRKINGNVRNRSTSNAWPKEKTPQTAFGRGREETNPKWKNLPTPSPKYIPEQ